MAGMDGGFNNSGAPLSPPGALSQRTDMPTQGGMALPDAAYGEQAEFQDIQAGAPMAGMAPPPGLMDPSMRPDEPVTSGIDMGDGVGAGALPSASVLDQDNQMLTKYLPQFERMASMEDTPDSFRQFVRYIRSAR